MKNYILAAASAFFVAFSVSAEAQSSFIVTLQQEGNNVVATGSGAFDLSPLTFVFNSPTSGTAVNPSEGNLNVGQSGSIDIYSSPSITGPTEFGSGLDTQASVGSGGFVGLSENVDEWLLPHGYVSKAAISDSSTWDNTTLTALGVTPGTYLWTWGPSNADSYTLDVVAAAPEPSAFWCIFWGLLGFVAWRRYFGCAVRAN